MKLIIFILLLLASPAWSGTYWVSTSGVKAGVCVDSASPQTTAAEPTIAQGIACLSAPGDTLYIRAGTYNERISVQPISGLPGNLTKIFGYPGETVTIFPQSLAATEVINALSNYVHWRHLAIDGSFNSGGASAVSVGGNNNVFEDIDVSNTSSQTGEPADTYGAGFYLNGANNLFTHIRSHHNRRVGQACVTGGNGACYGMYLHGAGNTVEYSEFDNNGAYGVHQFSSAGGSNNNTIRYNSFHDNGGTNGAGAGLLLSSGSNNTAYDNLIYDNAGNGIEMSGVGSIVFNNTIYGNNTSVTNYGGLAIGVPSGTPAQIKNNIIYGNTGADIYDTNGTGVTPTFATNICTTSKDVKGNPGWLGCAITGDPLFINAAGGNFQLKDNSSPAVNNGADLFALTGSSAYSTDYAGITRPQGAGWDIGAYEFVSGTIPTVVIAQPAGCVGSDTACTTTSATITLTGTSTLP